MRLELQIQQTYLNLRFKLPGTKMQRESCKSKRKTKAPGNTVGITKATLQKLSSQENAMLRKEET